MAQIRKRNRTTADNNKWARARKESRADWQDVTLGRDYLSRTFARPSA